jgi:hypothetical protein
MESAKGEVPVSVIDDLKTQVIWEKTALTTAQADLANASKRLLEAQAAVADKNKKIANLERAIEILEMHEEEVDG